MLAADLAITSVTSSIQFDDATQNRIVRSFVTVQNIGDAAVRGTAAVNMFLSTDDSVSPFADLQLARLLLPKIIQPGQRATVNLRQPVPHDTVGVTTNGITLSPGNYNLIAQISVSNGATDAVSSNNTAISATPVPIAYDFGLRGERSSVVLRTAVSNSSFAVIRLDGGGSGELVLENGQRLLRLSGTTSNSRLTIRSQFSFLNTSFSGMEIHGSIGLVQATKTDFTGDISIDGTVGEVVVRDVTGSAWRIGGGPGTARITARNLTNVSLASAEPISRFTLNNWANTDGSRDALVAPWIGTMKVTNSFSPDLNLGGQARPGTVFSSLTVGGAASGRWDIVGDSESIRVGSLSSTFGGNLAGKLKSLSVSGNMSGTLASAEIGNVYIGGNLANSVILAGASLGSDAALGGTGASADSFGSGRIGAFRVMGSMTASLVACGLNPGDTNLLGPDDRFVDTTSGLDTLVIRLDATGSAFAMPQPPKNALINGRTVSTASDPRFETLLP